MIFVRSLTALSLFLPLPLAAQVMVTEIMYDLAEGSDSGREWIEVYAVSTVDLTKLKLVENGSKHTIAAESSASIPAGSYAVIADNPAKFKNDNPNYTGLVFNSAFSLNNEGESLTITDASGAVFDAVAYTNASGNGTGDSLQRNPGSNQFDAGVPTPGLGIPVSGLIKSAPVQKASKKVVVEPLPQQEIVGESDFPSTSPFVASAAKATADSTWLWWFGPLVLAGFAGVGASLSRHYKKDEWDVVEEI